MINTTIATNTTITVPATNTTMGETLMAFVWSSPKFLGTISSCGSSDKHLQYDKKWHTLKKQSKLISFERARCADKVSIQTREKRIKCTKVTYSNPRQSSSIPLNLDRYERNRGKLYWNEAKTLLIVRNIHHEGFYGDLFSGKSFFTASLVFIHKRMYIVEHFGQDCGISKGF